MQIPRSPVRSRLRPDSRLAQLVERKTLNLVVVGSSPTVGASRNPWRNGSASDSRPEGWGFKSLWAHLRILSFAADGQGASPITFTPRISVYTQTKAVPEVLTWPGREFDQKGTAPSVEQDLCTLIAVKRYRDPPRIGGRHNFLL